MKVTIIPKSKEFEDLLRLYPPVKAKDILPDWYKSLKPGSYKDSWKSQHLGMPTDNFVTAKKCPAIKDYFGEGIVLPLWGKLYISTEKYEGKDVTYAAFTPDAWHQEKLLGNHIHQQVGDMDIGMTADGKILKIGMPYKILVPEGYNIMYQDPFYHFRNDIKALTGIVEADKWGFVNFPISIENSNCVVEAGTPFIYLHIYKKENIEMEYREGTDEEYKLNDLEKGNLILNEHHNYKTEPKLYKDYPTY